MKKLLAISLVGSSLFFGGYSAKADWDFWQVERNADNVRYDIFTVNSSNGARTLRSTKSFNGNSWAEGTSYVDGYNNLVIDGGLGVFHKYNLETDSWTDITFNTNSKSFARNSINEEQGSLLTIKDSQGDSVIREKSSGEIQIGGDTDDIDIVSDGLNIDGAAVITKNADGSIQIGADGNDIDITAEGLTVDGVSLITKKESGEIHIGKNSLITVEEDGVQKLYAKDEDGNAININVTNGSKLLIDGVEVTPSGTIPQVTTNKNNISTNKANIKNLGEGVAGSTALTAALSALPQTSKESKLSCGVGTGAYSSRYAVGFGCASKVNKRVDINAGGSYVFGGSKSYGGGTLDSGVVKAGFVFKLGELNKSTQISMKDKKVMETKIGTLTEKNEKLQNTVSTLMARLERLEKIASRDIKSKILASIKN